MMRMPDQQYCLRWNNHQPNFISTFSSLLTDECLVDVTLAAEGEYVRAHKIVLSASSTYFRKLFSVNPCQHPIVVLKDVSYRDLKSVIDFMYHGEINVNQEHLESVLKTAVALDIKGLADMAVTFTSEKKGTDHESSSSQLPVKRRKLKKLNRSESEVKNLSTEVQKVGLDDLNQNVGNQPENVSGVLIEVKEEANQEFENDSKEASNPTCSVSSKVLINVPSDQDPLRNEEFAGISVITGMKRRLLMRQGNVVKPSDADDHDENYELSEVRRSLIRQYSDPTPQLNEAIPDLPLPATTKKSRYLSVTNPHLQKQNSDSALTLPREDQQSTLLTDLINDPIKFQYSHPKSNHCPTLRPGPALGCNFCWNTIDLHGRILRRKTKYHCPECRTNLCIVPCFQEYHNKKESENENIGVKENVDDSSISSPQMSSTKKQNSLDVKIT